ncbi:DUF3102 domain-containing protein [Myxosarcina sp. GI1]|uniref:DUF3102 domain-containing protein n=1 Tax=Myxosarcina sp. GI1 TaxID=1541065 RepID=UPI00068F3157|nr:DUF3102 domain-containing protein [Myxosarcina sp. GI1]
MSKINIKNFNYTDLEPETTQFIHQQTAEIKALLKKTAQSIVEIGQKLTEVKQRIGHGKFGLWLNTEFNWSVSAANKFMQVSKEFKFINFTNLEIAPSALYKLAAPSAPAAARKEAIMRAETGEYVTYTIAKKLIQKHKSSSKAAVTSSEIKFETKTIGTHLLASTKFVDKKCSQAGQIFDSASLNNSCTSAKTSSIEIDSIVLQKVTSVTSSLELLVKNGDLWQLGNKHLLFCGEPRSQVFQKLIPAEISLSIAFPPRRSNWQHSSHFGAKTAFSLFTVYQDQDLNLLKQTFKQLLLLYTSEDDAVVFSYLADPELFTISHQLNCCCYIAEPNALLCSAAIAIWQNKTQKLAKHISCL